MAVVNASVISIAADTTLAESKQDIIDNFDDLLANDVDLEARISSSLIKFTSEGGLAIKLLNKTGAPSVKGTVVSASTGTDEAFMAQADEVSAIGVVYDNGVADAALCWVVIRGIAQVLLKDTTAATKGYFVYCSATDGRAETKAAPADDAEHFKQVGSCIEDKTQGTSVLTKCVLSFN